jgi:hypothetical protein
MAISSQKFSASGGTSALPSFSFNSDEASGLFQSATGELSFATNGTRALYINSSGGIAIGTVASVSADTILDLSTVTNKTIRLPQLTSIQRDALTPLSGMLFFNTDTNQLQIYNPLAASWASASSNLILSGSNVFAGNGAGSTISSGVNNVLIGDAADATSDLSNTVGLGSGAAPSSANSVVITSNGILGSFMSVGQRVGAGFPSQVLPQAATTAGDASFALPQAATAPVGTVANGGLIYISGNTLRFLASNGTDSNLLTGGSGATELNGLSDVSAVGVVGNAITIQSASMQIGSDSDLTAGSVILGNGVGSVGGMTGINNTVVGSSAGANITSGTDNVIIGNASDVSPGTLSDCIVIGSGASGTVANGLFLPTTLADNAVSSDLLGFNISTGQIGSMKTEILLTELSSIPSTPAAGKFALYADTTNNLSTIDSAGRETRLTRQDIGTKAPCIYATTPADGNITFGAAPNTIDGQPIPIAGIRILVKDQTDPTENGVYLVNVVGSGSDGIWVRTTDFNDGLDFDNGTIVAVLAGVTNARKLFLTFTDGLPPFTIGTTIITFVEFTPPATLAIEGLTNVTSDITPAAWITHSQADFNHIFSPTISSATGTNNTVYGQGLSASSIMATNRNTILGSNFALPTTNNNVLIGAFNGSAFIAPVDGTILIGNTTSAAGTTEASVCIGNSAVAVGSGISIGNFRSSSTRGINIGSGASSSLTAAAETIVIGGNLVSSGGTGAVIIGVGASDAQSNNIINIGKDSGNAGCTTTICIGDACANNMTSLNTSVMIGNYSGNASAYSNITMVGQNNTITALTNTVVIGSNITATKTNSMYTSGGMAILDGGILSSAVDAGGILSYNAATGEIANTVSIPLRSRIINGLGALPATPAIGKGILYSPGENSLYTMGSDGLEIDLINQSNGYKTPVLFATTTNINLAVAPATIDGGAVGTGARILVKDQTDPIENGIYVYNTSGNPMIRSLDFQRTSQISEGTQIYVSRGATNSDVVYRLDAVADIGVDNVTFTLQNAIPGNNLNNLGDVSAPIGESPLMRFESTGIRVGADANYAGSSVILGHNAGGFIVSSSNIIIGERAATAITGTFNNNVMVGAQSSSLILSGTNSVCIGSLSKIVDGASNSVAVGYNSRADNQNIALGSAANILGSESIGMGNQIATTATSSNNTLIGYIASSGIGANSTNNVVVGRRANISGSDPSANVSLGANATVTGSNSVVCGEGSTADGNSISIGQGVSSINNNNITIGQSSIMSGGDSILIGYNSDLSVNLSIVLGGNVTVNNGTNLLLVGNSTFAANATNPLIIGNSSGITSSGTSNNIILGNSSVMTAVADNNIILGNLCDISGTVSNTIVISNSVSGVLDSNSLYLPTTLQATTNSIKPLGFDSSTGKVLPMDGGISLETVVGPTNPLGTLATIVYTGDGILSMLLSDGRDIDLSYQDSGHKKGCRVASTTNIANVLTLAPSVLDSISLAVGDRVLVKNQTNQVENGIYVVDIVGSGSDGQWSRAQDFVGSNSIALGLKVHVVEGTFSGNRTYVMTSDSSLPGTDNIIFGELAGATVTSLNDLNDATTNATSTILGNNYTGTGTNTTSVGADINTGSFSFATVFGYDALVNADGAIVIGNATQSAGAESICIGNNAGQATFNINSYNTIIGTNCDFSGAPPSLAETTVIGGRLAASPLTINTNGNTIIGYDANVDLGVGGCVVLGNGAQGTISDSLFLKTGLPDLDNTGGIEYKTLEYQPSTGQVGVVPNLVKLRGTVGLNDPSSTTVVTFPTTNNKAYLVKFRVTAQGAAGGITNRGYFYGHTLFFNNAGTLTKDSAAGETSLDVGSAGLSFTVTSSGTDIIFQVTGSGFIDCNVNAEFMES